MSNLISGMMRRRLIFSSRLRGGGHEISGGHHEASPKAYPLNRTPPPPGESREWEDWELPCYVTSFLAIVILGVGLNAKPDLTLETWATRKLLSASSTKKPLPNLIDDGSSSVPQLSYACGLPAKLKLVEKRGPTKETSFFLAHDIQRGVDFSSQ